MTLNARQKREIKNILRRKLEGKIKEFEEREDMSKPFYFEMFSKKYVYIASLLQSVYTWFGGQWENFAEIIAEDNFSKVERRYTVNGKITGAEQAKIDTILKDLERGTRPRDIGRVKKELQEVYDEADVHKDVRETVDLYLETEEGEEYYFELKTPKPNKNEMRAAKRDLLDILAMRQKEKDLERIHTFVALPYNPYFSEKYTRWTVIKFFRLGDDLLVGQAFWDFLGGEGTYQELLGLFKEVGKEATDLLERVLERLETSSPTLNDVLT